MLVFLADHSMDWSLPHKLVSLAPVFDASPLLAGRVAIADNGGADLCYWTGRDADRAAAIEEMLRLSAPHEACSKPMTWPPRLSYGWGRRPATCWSHLGPAGDSRPLGDLQSGPGPTTAIPRRTDPVLPGRGHPIVPRGTASSVQAYTIDVAPTVAASSGYLHPPTAGRTSRL